MKGKLTKMYEIVRTHKITFYPEEIQIEFEDIENNVCEILFETYEVADEMLENEICLNYDTFTWDYLQYFYDNDREAINYNKGYIRFYTIARKEYKIVKR